MAADSHVLDWEWVREELIERGWSKPALPCARCKRTATQDNLNVRTSKAKQCHKTQACFNDQEHMFIDTEQCWWHLEDTGREARESMSFLHEFGMACPLPCFYGVISSVSNCCNVILPHKAWLPPNEQYSCGVRTIGRYIAMKYSDFMLA